MGGCRKSRAASAPRFSKPWGLRGVHLVIKLANWVIILLVFTLSGSAGGLISEVRHKESKQMYIPNTKYYLTVAVTVLIASWLLSSLVEFVIKPDIDRNAHAYLLLVESAESGTYASMESLAREAQRLTTDQDIHKLADLIARSANFGMRSGSSTPQESGSFTGFTKGFIAGFLNPIIGLEGGAFLIEMFFTDIEGIGNRIDNRYLPVFKAYNRAKSIGSWIFWILIIGCGVAYAKIPKAIEQQLLEMASRFEWLEIETTAEIG